MKKILLIFFSISIVASAYSQTWNGTTSTAWEDATNWSTGLVPTTATNVTIPTSPTGGRFPTISTGTQGVKDFIIQSGATVTMTGGTLQCSHDWKNSGTFNASAGTVQFTASSGAGANYATGTNNFFNVIINSGVDPGFNNAANSNLNIAGDFTNNNSGYSDATGYVTFNLNGTGNQTLYSAAASASTIGVLTINKSAGTVTLGSFFKVSGNFTLTAGTFSTGTSYGFTVGGNALFTAGSCNFNASTVAVTGNFTNNGTSITGGSCAVTVSGDYTRGAGTFSAASGTLSIGGNWVNNKDANLLSIGSVTLTGIAKTIGGTYGTAFTGLLVTGTITMNTTCSASSFSIPANSTPTSLAHANGTTFTVNGDVTLNQATANEINEWAINAATVSVTGNVSLNVTASNAGRVVKIVITSGTLNISGNLSMNNTILAANSVLDMSGGAGNLNLTGAFSVTSLGTLTPGTTSTFRYNGAGPVTVAGGSAIAYNNLSVAQTSGTVTAGGALSLSGLLTVNSAVTVDMVTHALSGTFTTSGLTILKTQNISATPIPSGLTWSGTVYYNSASAQTIVNGNYNNLDGSGGARTLGTTINIAGAFTTGNGVYTVTGSTVNFNGSSAQSIPSLTYNTLAISGSGVKTLNSTVSTALITIAAGSVLNQTGGSINLTAQNYWDGTFSMSGGTLTTNNNININAGGVLNQSGGLIHLAATTGAIPSEQLKIASGGTINQSGGTLYVKDYVSSPGTFNQTNSSALFKIYRDWKPGAGSVFNATAGTVEFTGVGGGDFATGTRQFANILISAGDPGFSNTLNSTIPISGNFTNQVSTISTLSNATIILNGTGTQNVTGTGATFDNLTINKASGSVVLLSDIGFSGTWNNSTNTTLSGGSYSVKFTGTGSISGTTTFPNVVFTAAATSYTLNNDNTFATLTFDATGISTALTQNGTTNLVVSGDVTINQPTASGVTSAWNINGGSATVGGNVNLGGLNTTSSRISKVALTTGTLTVNGNLVYNSATGVSTNAIMDLSGGAAILNLKGSLLMTNGSGNITPGILSTVYYNGTGAQTVGAGSAISYYNLNINKSSGTATLGNNLTVVNMILTQGTLSASASNYNITVDGNWTNNGGTYSGGSGTVTMDGATGNIGGTTSTTFPTLAIFTGSAYTMSNNNSCSALVFNAAGTANSLTHSGSSALTVSGAVTINQPTSSSVTTAWNINAGTATVSGLISFPGTNTTASRVAKIVLTTGTLNANNGMTFTASANATKVIDMSGGAAVLNLKGALTVPALSGTLTAGSAGSIFNYADDVNAQTINFFPSGAYHNLRTTNTSSTGVVLSAAITTSNVTGNFRVLNGICDNGGFAITLNASKIFEVANSATMKFTGTSGMVTGTSITKTFGATSTVDYAGTTQSVSAETYGHLIFSNSGVKTMPGTAFTVAGNLSTSGSISATAGNAITVGGNVTWGAGTSFNGGSYTHNVAGNWTNNGATFTPATSTINLNGTSSQTLGGSAAALTLNNLTISNISAAITVNTNTNIAGTLNLNGSNTLITPAADVVFNNAGAAGTITGSGTVQVTRLAATPDYSSQYKFTTNTISNLTVDFSGAGSQTVNAFTYGGLKFSGSGTKTASGNITVNNTLNLFAATFALGANSLTLLNNISRTSGSIDAVSGSVIFNGSSAQSVAASAFSTAINNLTINNAAGVTMNADHTVTTLLTLTAGTLNLGTSTATINGSISRTSGNMDASAGTLIFSGSSAQSIPNNTLSGSFKNLTINNAAGVTISADHTITGTLSLTSGTFAIGSTNCYISGNITRSSGNINGANATVIFNGSAAQSIPANIFLNNGLKNLKISNSSGVSLGGDLELSDVLSFGSVNNATFAAGGYLKLKSNATNTARVADVTNAGTNSGNTITGNVTVERYFPNDGRRYRMITPGVTTSSSIKANWQEGANNTVIGTNVNPVPAYGTQITGAGGNANGFDASQTNNASLFTFNQATNGWVAVGNTNISTLSSTQTYLIFLRGDRSVDMTSQANPLPGSATTLRATGSLNIGTQTYSSLNSNGGLSMLANPYASPISWSAIYGNNSSNFENYYTFWDPKLGSRGGYVTITSTGLKSDPSSNATVEIQGGQAFFVRTKTGVSSPSLSIREIDKSTTSNVNVFRLGTQTEQLSTSLYYYDAASVRVKADNVLSAYNNQYSAGIDNNDATQIGNWDEDICIKRQGQSLSIETRPLIDQNDTIYLNVARLKIQGYELQFNPSSFNAAGLNAFLVDNFTNTETPISLSAATVVPFSVTSAPASSATGRFMIVFRSSGVLPVKLLKFSGKLVNDVNVLNWVTASEESFAHFEIENSTDQSAFTKIGTVQAKGNASTETEYSFTHNSTAPRNYYRLKQVDKDGKFTYSPVIMIRRDMVHINISHVYPNPFADELNIDMHAKVTSSGTMCLYNMQGQVMRKIPITIVEGKNTLSLQNLQALGAGTYILTVKSELFEYSSRVVKAK